jgi:5-methylcytosine-specific restriction enzyme A
MSTSRPNREAKQRSKRFYATEDVKTTRKLCPGNSQGPCPDRAVVDGPPRGTTRCPKCKQQREQIATARRPTRRSYAEQERRKRAVAEWVELNGWVCPGFETPPHPSLDLTADHIVEVAVNRNEGGELQVLCQACNTRKSARRGRWRDAYGA